MTPRLFVSPPFGQRIPRMLFPRQSVFVHGSWTLNPRPGLMLQVLKTLRYRKGAWENRIGLRNNGIREELKTFATRVLDDDTNAVSFAAAENDDWKCMQEYLFDDMTVMNTLPNIIELNVSCPSVELNYQDKLKFIKSIQILLKEHDKEVILKLGPHLEYEDFEQLIDIGFDRFHVCNTLPLKTSNRSGADLRPYVKRSIRMIRKLEGLFKINIVAGGGVDSIEVAQDYLNEGADDISVSSLCFNPFELNMFLKEWKIKF